MKRQIFGSWQKKYFDYENSKIVLLPVPYDETKIIDINMSNNKQYQELIDLMKKKND